MAYHERQYRRRISLAQANNALVLLIAINVIVFIILVFLQGVFKLRYDNNSEALHYFKNNILTQFILPADAGNLLQKPWTLFVYFFTEINVWRLLGSMLWLWVFGYIFLDLTGNRKIVPLYLYGALAGAIVFMAAYNLVPSLRPHLSTATLMGPSAAVMAIAVAVTTISPGYRVFPMLNGGIPIWVLTAIYVVIDLTSLSRTAPGDLIAHLTGALTGFLFIYSFQRGYDWSEWMNNFFDWVSNLFNPDKPKKGKSVRQELFYKATTKPYQKTPNITEQRVNEILDKINQKGYSSLTDEEKDLLKRASQENL